MGYALNRQRFAQATAATASAATSAGITPEQLASRDAFLRKRENHTGRQTMDTIEGLATALDAKPDENDLRTLAKECVDRSNHAGSQPIQTIEGLTDVLASKADKTAVFQTTEALKGLVDQNTRQAAEFAQTLAQSLESKADRSELPRIHAESVPDLASITEPKFGVIYAVAGQGSFMLSADGTQWIQIGTLA